MTRLARLLTAGLLLCASPSVFAAGKDFYQIRIYHLKSAEQETRLDQFLEKAYLPALHRTGISAVGVFKPVVPEADRLVYVFIPFKSADDFMKLEGKLLKDRRYQDEGKDYLAAVYTDPPYVRLESILLSAFEKSPKYLLSSLTGPKKNRIYELRSYESHTERISKNKIAMFNDGDEIGLFKRLGFNAVFYGEVISGSHMPNLMYLTTFDDKAARDAHWAAFSKDEQWKVLSAKPEYKNNVSKNEQKFLYPAEYSEI